MTILTPLPMVSQGVPATPHYTAPSQETAISIVNPSSRRVHFFVTTDDTRPTQDIELGMIIEVGGERQITLNADERLWLGTVDQVIPFPVGIHS